MAPEVPSYDGPHGYDARPGPWSPRALTEAEREAVTADLAALDAAMVPAGAEYAVKCLAHLSLLVARPSDMTPQDARLKLDAMARELGQYPAQALGDACREHARTSKWFPTLSELVQPIEAALAEQSKARARMTALLDFRPRTFGPARVGELMRRIA